MKKWEVKSKDIAITVQANDQWEAFDALKDYGKARFGLVCTAMPVGGSEANEFPCRTSKLMARWGRNMDSEAFSREAERLGLGYVSDVLPEGPKV